MSNTDAQRRAYLNDWARRIDGAAARGLLGKPITIRSVTPVNGPRAGVLEFHAGFEAGALLKALAADDHAILRQLVPWPFIGEPQAFMSERSVRVEAGWPRELADDDIRFSALGQHPTGGGRWLVGRNENGNVPTLALDDMTPHWLFSGATGSGKSTAMVSAIAQLSRDPANRFILVDIAKHGASFTQVAQLQGCVGPVCADLHQARSALMWAVGEMANRYGGARDDRRLIVCIDEAQNIAEDMATAAALTRLVEQGRGARVHVLAATQNPTVENVGGSSVARNFTGRFALRVIGFEASRVAVGGRYPRADRLLGRGDAYLVKLGLVHRCQVAWFDGILPHGDPDLREWPEDGNGDMPDPSGWPSSEEVGAALLAVNRGEGRKRLQQRTIIRDNNRANQLLKLARGALDWLGNRGVDLCLSENGDTHTDDE